MFVSFKSTWHFWWERFFRSLCWVLPRESRLPARVHIPLQLSSVPIFQLWSQSLHSGLYLGVPIVSDNPHTTIPAPGVPFVQLSYLLVSPLPIHSHYSPTLEKPNLVMTFPILFRWWYDPRPRRVSIILQWSSSNAVTNYDQCYNSSACKVTKRLKRSFVSEVICNVAMNCFFLEMKSCLLQSVLTFILCPFPYKSHATCYLID